MRLKSIELIGFKSFPDRTLLDFNSGVTVVVGPNGSGKSNISDAIRWVLGELSAKSVRGTKMEDVIFGGSDKRKPLPFAEVSLTIDNTANIESGRIDSEYDEITVTRRCYRNGESEYQINRKPVRLRDISELFMNTGVGKTGYSIIGQGKIAEIISAKSEERRTIFEEAAGISKYRYKKTEAERKLAATDENLVRLGDIFSGLEERIGPLEKESEKARRYLEIYEQKKQTDVRLWLYDLTQIKRREEDAAAEYTIAKTKFETADEALASLEARNDRLFGANQENKLRSDRLSESITASRGSLHSLETDETVTSHDITHLKQQISDTEESIRMRTAAKRDAEEALRQANAKRDALINGLSGLDMQRAEAGEKLSSLRADRAEIESSQDRTKNELDRLTHAITDAKIEQASLKSSRENGGSRINELSGELEEITSGREKISARIQSAEKTIADYTAQADEIKKQLESKDSGLSALKNELEECTAELNRLSLDRMSRNQRAETLKRMDELFEGYANSVKAVMKASESGRLSGICGPVSHLISVDRKFSTAVETAAGASIQNIIVENENAAKNAIRYLKDTNSGRATFCPLTSIKSSPLNISEQSLSSYRGYLGIASSLVECDSRYREVIEYMLGRTVVFDNLDNATEMAKATGYRVRAVTLDGQQINVGGSFTGGSVKHDTGMLTRSSEIAKLNEEIVSLDIKITAKKEKAEELGASIESEKKRLSADSDKLALLNRLSQAENTQLMVLRSRCDSDDERAKNIEKEIINLRRRYSDSEKSIADIESRIAVLEGKASELSKSVDEKEEQRLSLAREIAKADSALNSLLLKIAEQKKDIEAAENSLRLASDGLDSVSEKLERDISLLSEYREKEEQTKLRLNGLAAEKAELESEIAKLEEELDELTKLEIAQDNELAQLHTRIKEQTRIRENLFREYNRLETRQQQIGSEQEKLTSKLWDEYELTYTSASELGYPALEESERGHTVTRQNELRSKLRAMGSVNLGAIDEYREVSEKHSFMKEQLDDLNSSKAELTDIITRIDREMCERFITTMDELNVSFNSVFRELFGGGSAELKLSDPSNVLESGIEINVAPPGKIIKSMSLLSGGEQSFVAIALFYAILNINPTPFCVLDEIEAALDDVNVIRFAEYAKRYSEHTQFIINTHRRGTMERADTIYGVTMPERGISKVLTLNVDEIEAKSGIKL